MTVAEIQISKIMFDCLANPGDVGAIYVKAESLMTFEGWLYPEIAKQNFDAVVEHVKKLPKQFLDAEGGWTFSNLGYFDDGQGGIGEQWGNPMDAGCLIVLCAYYGMFQDPLHTLNFKWESLADLPGGVTYCSFNVEPNFIDMVKTHLKIK